MSSYRITADITANLELFVDIKSADTKTWRSYGKYTVTAPRSTDGSMTQEVQDRISVDVVHLMSVFRNRIKNRSGVLTAAEISAFNSKDITQIGAATLKAWSDAASAAAAADHRGGKFSLKVCPKDFTKEEVTELFNRPDSYQPHSVNKERQTLEFWVSKHDGRHLIWRAFDRLHDKANADEELRRRGSQSSSR